MSLSAASSASVNAVSESYRNLGSSMQKISSGDVREGTAASQESVRVQVNATIMQQARDINADMIGKLINTVA